MAQAFKFSNTFQSTPSVWRETAIFIIPFCFFVYFNPLPPYGGRPEHGSASAQPTSHFNPLPPYGGRRITPLLYLSALIFQSTPSVWRETSRRLHRSAASSISIHSLRMEGDCDSECRGRRCAISIHSLRMEGDKGQSGIRTAAKGFQSTPSVWRETDILRRLIADFDISIHSLRMEGDYYHYSTG